MKRLDNKVALVTGGSRGIGKGIALRLAEEGHWSLFITETAGMLRMMLSRPYRFKGASYRLRCRAGIGRWSQRAYSFAEGGAAACNGDQHFDILVNNAGIGTSKTFEETTEESFDELLAVNVKAPFFLVQQALPLLRDGGRIVNISSGVTRIAYPHIMAYNITKGAINTFTLHLAKLLGPRGITVNAVLPGIVDTDVNAAWLHTPEGQQHAAEMSALGRIGQPSDIADVVAFLSSSDGRWVTGQMVDATGGSHL